MINIELITLYRKLKNLKKFKNKNFNYLLSNKSKNHRVINF